MSDFTLNSLRGGMNNSDPAIALPMDQGTLMLNVEINRSMLGERRRGTDAIDLSALLQGAARISFLHRHIPGTDETAAELFVAGYNGSTRKFGRKTTAWTEIDLMDPPPSTGFYPYQWAAVSFRGKVFLAHGGNEDRLHVIEAGALTSRRAGMGAPNPPTPSNPTGSGTLAGLRYYRVRYTRMSGSTILARGEPSLSVDFTPVGHDPGVLITKPSTIGESETHWELEASLDDVNFYLIATTVVATTTVTDTQDYATGYSVDFPLSADIGDYTAIPSVKYLIVDDDRLVGGGSWFNAAFSSRIVWTPVNNADGVGNDERMELDTDPSVDLDGLDGGPLTGLSSAVSGEIFAFKLGRIYKLIRTGVRTRAYSPVCVSKERGALHGSVVPGVDQMGRPCVYFLDPTVGPCRAGVGGIKQCGADIRTTWETVNGEATKVVCSGLYYSKEREIIWCIATAGADIPNLGITLQVNEVRDSDDGLRRGWTTWSGTRASALTMCLFSSNIDDNTARNRVLVPFIGTEGLGLVHRCDTGVTDNGTAYAARIVTRPYTLKTLLHKFGVMAGVLLAKAVTGAKVDVKVIRDFGLETTTTVSNVAFDAVGAETDVIKVLDSLKGSELRVAQFEFVDTASAGTRFELNQLCLIESPQQSN